MNKSQNSQPLRLVDHSWEPWEFHHTGICRGRNNCITNYKQSPENIVRLDITNVCQYCYDLTCSEWDDEENARLERLEEIRLFDESYEF
jgi:hypothetical protein